jgi:hypothetical protein
METFTETKLINLNSKDAILNNSTYLSDVYFNLNGILQDDEDIIEKYISIQNAQIPFSFYNINVYNNILKLIISSTTYTIILTRGNYNATSLITELTTQLNNNLITDISITISPITGILTFQKLTGSFQIISAGSTIYEVLGFVPNVNYNSVSQIINAPYPLNLLGTLRLRICSFEIATNNKDYSLISIPIDIGNFGLIQYTNISNIRAKLNNTSLDGFDILIIDDDNNHINFNNINWTMTILLTVIRKKTIISNTKFKDIINSAQSENIDNTEEQNNINEIPQDENNINENNVDEVPQDENNIDYQMNEPIQDDLDLLLYNNHGQL